MSDLWMLSEAQMRRIEPYFPLSHGIPRVDDRRIVSGIIFVIRNANSIQFNSITHYGGITVTRTLFTYYRHPAAWCL